MNKHEPQDEETFVNAVRRQVERSQKGRRTGFWQGLTTFGLIGWMVALPAVGGALLGRWLDGHLAMKPFSWTLCLIILGLALGCASAWQYVDRALKR